MTSTHVATGIVENLLINGELGGLSLTFFADGPAGDRHSGLTRRLNGHDGDYMKTSMLRRGEEVFNWRQWTALSSEELGTIAKGVGASIPPGMFLENLIISRVPHFSKLPPTTRLIFPSRGTQLVLAVWGENGPCRTIGQRLAEFHKDPALTTELIKHAQGRRGVMGWVIAPGVAMVGDDVQVWSPVR
jgi:hypothetical protein